MLCRMDAKSVVIMGGLIVFFVVIAMIAMAIMTMSTMMTTTTTMVVIVVMTLMLMLMLMIIVSMFTVRGRRPSARRARSHYSGMRGKRCSWDEEVSGGL